MLEIRDLSVFYGDAQALDGVNLSVGDGQVVALVGANGAGKTSLIRTVAGILKPRAGSIRFDGREIGGLDSHHVCNLGIGQVAEGRQVFPTMTVQENLETGGMLPRAACACCGGADHVFAMFPS
jgi:branched-chain amino acid transport system ATP-binding protein